MGTQIQIALQACARAAKAAGSVALDTLYPRYCRLCELPSGRSIDLCGHCEDQLSLNIHCCSRCALPLPRIAHKPPERLCPECMAAPLHFEHTIAPFIYDDDIALLISRWKYGRDFALVELMAELWWRYAQITHSPDLLLPVPLHWQRLLSRGFNQAELLAQAIHRRHPQLARTRLAPRILRRRRATDAQARLGRRQRQLNTGSAFVLRGEVQGLRVAIVDDVCTTGATANAIAAQLRGAGAAQVELWCLARTPAPQRDQRA